MFANRKRLSALALACLCVVLLGLVGCQSTKDRLVGRWVIRQQSAQGVVEFTKDGFMKQAGRSPARYAVAGDRLTATGDGITVAGTVTWISNDCFAYAVREGGTCDAMTYTYDRQK